MINNKLFWFTVLLMAAMLVFGGILVQYWGLPTQTFSMPMPFVPVAATSEGDSKEMIYRAAIVKVIDGDTITVVISVPIPWGKNGMFLLVPEWVRICCIDTPESSRSQAKCEEEIQLGQKAKDYLTEILTSTTKVLLSHVDRDKYGRLLAKVATLNGQDIGEMMIDKKLAKPYYGKTKSSWCSETPKAPKGDKNGDEKTLAK